MALCLLRFGRLENRAGMRSTQKQKALHAGMDKLSSAWSLSRTYCCCTCCALCASSIRSNSPFCQMMVFVNVDVVQNTGFVCVRICV